MKERPILFSAPMVRAILTGTKTVTRRIVRDTGLYAIDASIHGAATVERELLALATRCPYGAPGDRLWVRETWGRSWHHAQPPAFYRATDDLNGYSEFDGWRPSIHMPRWASRLTLDVLSVRVERLHAIDDADAMREGVYGCRRCGGHGIDPVRVGHDPDWCAKCGGAGPRPRDDFAALWDSINGARAPWSSNPWVWRVEFARAEVRR